MNPTRVWRDKAGGWHMPCEAPCCTHTTCPDQAMAFEAALGHVAYWHRISLAEAWRQGALWAAVECAAIPDESTPWLVEGENPYEKRATGSRTAAQSPGEWLGHRDEARAQGGTW